MFQDSTAIAESAIQMYLPALSQAVCRALNRCEMSLKEAAIAMELTPAQLSRQLHTTGVNEARLCLLPRTFWAAYIPMLAELNGVPLASGPDARLAHLEETVAQLLERLNGPQNFRIAT